MREPYLMINNSFNIRASIFALKKYNIELISKIFDNQSKVVNPKI